MTYESESKFEAHIRSLIREHVTRLDERVYALRNKKAVDILICKDFPQPALFFIEVKYHKSKHGRLGFGGSKGGGFQPEIVARELPYFETNLRWALASEVHEPEKVLFVSSKVLRRYLSGGKVGEKFNNIQSKVFREQPWLSEQQFIQELRLWLGIEVAPSVAARSDA
ncbi:hypothetical protein [Roseateles sp. P5_E1]